MHVAATPARIDTTQLSLEQVAENPNITAGDKVKEAARQFEAILLRQILTDVRKPVIRSSLESDGTVNGIYADMVNNTLADAISRSGMLGLARSLQKELTHQTLGRAGSAGAPDQPPAAHPAATSLTDRHD